jgi:hypothetical protein
MKIKGDGKHFKDSVLVGDVFENTLKELSVSSEFNFFKFEPSTIKAAYTPYVFAGVGLVNFKYKKKDEKVNEGGEDKKKEDDKEKYKPAIIFGTGFKYNLKGNFTIDSHLSYRLAGTDILDNKGSGWTGSFFDKIKGADSYMTFQIGLTYTVFKQGCPTW